MSVTNPSSLDDTSDLEDGELPGEHADDYEVFPNPPSKQRKLVHGDTAGKAGREGGQPTSSRKQEKRERGHQQHPGRQKEGSGGSSTRKNRESRHQKYQHQHQQHLLEHRNHQQHTTGQPQQKKQQQSKHAPAHKAAAAGGSTRVGATESRAPAATESKSGAFEAHKAALKARLQSLEVPDVEAAPEGKGGGGGGRGGGRSAATPLHGSGGGVAAGKGWQQAAWASPAAAAAAAAVAGVGGGGGAGKYVAEIYKGAVPSVEIKGGGSGSGPSPHPIRLADVQSLVLWVLSPAGNLVEAPRWAFVKNKPLVEGVVLVLASGLSSAMMREKRHLLPFLSTLGRAATVHTSPQAKPAHSTAELLTTKATLRNLKRKRASASGGETAPPAAAAATPSLAVAPADTGGGGTDDKAAANAAGDGAQRGQQQPDSSSSRGGVAPPAASSGQAPPPPAPPPAGMTLPPGPFPPSHYIATLEQLKRHNYPLPSLEEGQEGEEDGSGSGMSSGGFQRTDPPGRLVCPPGFVATQPSGDPTASERMVALDCEMCVTEAGFELTRITLVAGPGWEPGTAAGAAAAAAGFGVGRVIGCQGGGGGSRSSSDDKDDGMGEGDGAGMLGGSAVYGGRESGGGLRGRGFPSGAVLMDELVVPERPILDHNTRYSGITAQMLQGCTNRLEDVRARFLALVPAESLLVGHALENDLAALRTCHGRLLDTALLFPHPKGPPFKSALKILARRFLRRTIQDGAHDSAVDARTALDLALLKIKHGPSYGCGGSGPHAASPRVAEVLWAHCGTRCCLVDRHDVVSRFVSGTTAAVPVASDDDAVTTAGRQAASRTYGFVWTQLTEVAVFMFRRARHKARLEEKWAAEAAEAAAAAGTAATATNAAAAAGAAAGAAGGKQRPATIAAAAAAQGKRRDTTALASTAAAAAAATGASSDGAVGAVVGTVPGNPSATNGSGPGSAIGQQPDYSDAVLDELLVSYDDRLRRLWDALPPRYMLVIATGAGDTAEYDRLYEQKCKRCNRESGLPPWTLREEEALVDRGAREMQALCFAAVKGEGSRDGGAGGGSEKAGGGSGGRKAGVAGGE